MNSKTNMENVDWTRQYAKTGEKYSEQIYFRERVKCHCTVFQRNGHYSDRSVGRTNAVWPLPWQYSYPESSFKMQLQGIYELCKQAHFRVCPTRFLDILRFSYYFNVFRDYWTFCVSKLISKSEENLLGKLLCSFISFLYLPGWSDRRRLLSQPEWSLLRGILNRVWMRLHTASLPCGGSRVLTHLSLAPASTHLQ